MAFEWDERKSQANLAKHGIDFHTASLAFDDPFALTMRDELHNDEESRFIEAVRRGEEALQRGEYLTHEQVGERLERFLRPG